MRSIFTRAAPPPNGHYSQAVVTDGMFYLSNQLALLPDGSGRMPDNVVEQARQAIVNCRSILAAFGCDLCDVPTATIHVANIEDWPRIDAVWAEMFGDHRPARSVVAVAQLHLGALVAVQVSGVRPRRWHRLVTVR